MLARVVLRAGAGRRPGDLAGGDLVVAMAARQPAGIGGDSSGGSVSQIGDAIRAARREAAAGRRGREIRRQALDGFELGAARPVEPRHRAQQAHRVGMARPVEHGVGVALLDQRAPHT